MIFILLQSIEVGILDIRLRCACEVLQYPQLQHRSHVNMNRLYVCVCRQPALT